MMTHHKGQRLLQPMDIEYFQIHRGPAGGLSQLWLKARAMAQPHLVGQFEEGPWNLLAAMSAFATRNGIPVYQNLSGAVSTGHAPAQQAPAVQQPYATQQAYPAQQPHPAQQQPYQAQQQPYQAQQQHYQAQQPYQAQQQHYQAQQPHQAQPPYRGPQAAQRPASRPPYAQKKKGKGSLFLIGLVLILIAIAVASSAADKSAAVALIVIGIILLLISGNAGKSRSGRPAGVDRRNDPNTWQDDYANTSGSFIDRDHDGIDDRYDTFIDSDNDGIPDSADNDSGGGGSDD